MPELPEVETIKLGLSKRIIGKTIKDIKIETQKSFQGTPKDIIGTKIIDIERRAKLIRIRLSNDLNLLFHLKLTGQLIVIDHNERFAGGHPSHDWHAKLPNSNTRIVFNLSGNIKLYFNDLRKFGWCKVLKSDAIVRLFDKDYGLEPLDKNFTVEYLLEKAKRLSNRNIKQFLMDQTIAAGMGNIYTDETLYEAKISPQRKVKDISMKEGQKLINSMKIVLNKGLKYGGTTDSDYVNAEGKKGGMQDHLNVYHQTGKKCPNNCGGVIKRITIGSRGTHYCPNCQA